MDEIFLLEDEPNDLQLAKEMLARVAGRKLRFRVAQSLEEAERILEGTAPGSFDLLLFDLLVPRDQRSRVDRTRDLLNGLVPLRSAWRAGHRSGVFILSNLMDDPEVRDAALRALKEDRVAYADCLEKASDLDGIDSWKTHFGPYLEDLQPFKSCLHDRAGLLIVHRAQESVLRQLLRRLRLGLKLPPPRLDCLLLTGEAGAGKTSWARGAAWMKATLSGEEAGIAGEALFDTTSLSSFSSADFTDTDRLKLFGGRDYNHQYVDGTFIKASYYPSCTGGHITRCDPAAALPDRSRGGVALIDEFMSASPACQDSMLQVLENGTVEVIGALPGQYRVACTAAFASNLELVVRPGGAGEQRGEMGEAFRSRLGPALRIPSLRELGWQAAEEIFRDTLLRRLDNPREIAPAALELLRGRFEEDGLTMRDLRDLVDTVKAKRITPGAIEQMGPRRSSKAEKVSSSPLAAGGEVQYGASEKAGGNRQYRQLLLPVQQEELTRGVELWARVRATGGKAIENDLLKVVDRLAVSPQVLLSMILSGYAGLQDGEVSRRDFDGWLGLSAGNALRHKLRTLGRRHPAIFGGPGKRPLPTIKDLDALLVKYRLDVGAIVMKHPRPIEDGDLAVGVEDKHA